MLIGKSCHVRAIPGIPACVIYSWQTFVLAHRQPKRIIDLLATIQLAALEHLLE